MRRLRLAPLALVALAVALLVPAGALAAPAGAFVADAGTTGVTGAVATEPPPLPACRYIDQHTRFDELKQWRKTLVDTNLRVARSYKPTDLVSVHQAGIEGTGLIRRVAIADLRAMADAARKAGKGIAVRSAYRSYTQQISTFNGWVARSGYRQALLYSARPGHSEHQLGTTIDFRSASSATPPWGYSDWATTPSGRWMAQNAWKYGWIMSYPKGKRSQVCYGYEPWHYRYIGRDLAKQVHDLGWTLRRFLWRTFETQ
ncbi:MAG: M15 family metallopeptidase [Chloroflexota bacterium]